MNIEQHRSDYTAFNGQSKRTCMEIVDIIGEIVGAIN